MIELYPHQREAVDQMTNGCILYGDVGSGKSITAVAYYKEKESPKDVYVITTAKKRDDRDWQHDFAKIAVGESLDTTTAGVLTVDSWNNIGKYEHVSGAFFILDEQRLVGSGEWSTKFLKIARSNSWILLSATPGDTWLDYIPVFIANGFYKNRTQFKREHVVYNTFTRFPKVDRYINEGKLIKLRNQLLVEMPFHRHTVRHTKEIWCDYDRELFNRVVQDRWHVYENRPLKDVAELFLVMRKVVNSDSSRIQTMLRLLDEHPRLIVFYNFNYELEALRTALASVQSGSATRLVTEMGIGTRTRTESSGSTSRTREAESISLETGTRSIRDSIFQMDGRFSEGLETPELTLSHATTGSSLFGSREIPTLDSIASAATATSPLQTTARTETTPTTSITTSGFGLEVAEWNGHKHQPVPLSERWVYLVQYIAGSEGWNCTTTNATMFYSQDYSYKRTAQAFGRTDRINTPFKDLFYYVLKSPSMIDLAIAKSLSEKRSFNERRFLSQTRTVIDIQTEQRAKHA